MKRRLDAFDLPVAGADVNRLLVGMIARAHVNFDLAWFTSERTSA
jgi:hypothetical protein